MTLMTHGNNEGTRRCDARCYNAKGPTCDCICHGANHGKGLARAQQNVQRYGEKILAEIAERERQEERARGQLFVFEGGA